MPTKRSSHTKRTINKSKKKRRATKKRTGQFIYVKKDDRDERITATQFKKLERGKKKMYIKKTKPKRPTKLRLRAPKLTGGWDREETPEFDMRSFRMMRKIFDHDPNAKKVTVTQKMMAHAKKVVTAELLRQRALSTTKGGAPLEHAFYIATGEPTLFFDYTLMLKMVRDCELVELTREMDPDYLDAYATTCPFEYKILMNKRIKMSADDLRMTLMHEALHCTVERRGRQCHAVLSTDVEHLAMALLGDPDCIAELSWWRRKRVKAFAKQGRLKNAGIRRSEDWWYGVTGGYDDDADFYDNPKLESGETPEDLKNNPATRYAT